MAVKQSPLFLKATIVGEIPCQVPDHWMRKDQYSPFLQQQVGGHLPAHAAPSVLLDYKSSYDGDDGDRDVMVMVMFNVSAFLATYVSLTVSGYVCEFGILWVCLLS